MSLGAHTLFVGARTRRHSQRTPSPGTRPGGLALQPGLIGFRVGVGGVGVVGGVVRNAKDRASGARAGCCPRWPAARSAAADGLRLGRLLVGVQVVGHVHRVDHAVHVGVGPLVAGDVPVGVEQEVEGIDQAVGVEVQ